MLIYGLRCDGCHKECSGGRSSPKAARTFASRTQAWVRVLRMSVADNLPELPHTRYVELCTTCQRKALARTRKTDSVFDDEEASR